MLYFLKILQFFRNETTLMNLITSVGLALAFHRLLRFQKADLDIYSLNECLLLLDYSVIVEIVEMSRFDFL